MFSQSFEKRFLKSLNDMPISRVQKAIIQSRYVDMVADAEYDYRYICFAYIILTNLITISGVGIAALSPLEDVSWMSPAGSRVIFWIVWGMAIALTLSNKWIHAFDVPKKYVLGIVILEKLYGEGWSFVAGVGRYEHCATYDDRVQLFCTRVEKIKVKTIESMPELDSNGVADSILAAGSNNAHTVTDTPGEPTFTKVNSRHSKRPKDNNDIDNNDIDNKVVDNNASDNKVVDNNVDMFTNDITNNAKPTGAVDTILDITDNIADSNGGSN